MYPIDVNGDTFEKRVPFKCDGIHFLEILPLFVNGVIRSTSTKGCRFFLVNVLLEPSPKKVFLIFQVFPRSQYRNTRTEYSKTDLLGDVKIPLESKSLEA